MPRLLTLAVVCFVLVVHTLVAWGDEQEQLDRSKKLVVGTKQSPPFAFKNSDGQWTYLSSIANRTNDVMKVLTIMASIFIPLTFVAGIYGMNFEHMPELHVSWAYPLVWTTMAAVAGGMLTFFWRKSWIGKRTAASTKRP